MRDTHADGAAGYVSYGDLRPTELGGRIGANASRAVISAAGSAAQAGASMAQFAVGYAVRKDHPVIGYTLMAASSVQHLSNSLYLWSAAGMSAGELAEAASTGHDWASFAAATGVNPTLTALAYTALLPAEALVLHLIGKAVQKKKDDQRALASLISRGEITEADLLRLYDGYPEKARLQAAEASVAALASGQGSPADDPTAADEAAKQKIATLIKTGYVEVSETEVQFLLKATGLGTEQLQKESSLQIIPTRERPYYLLSPSDPLMALVARQRSGGPDAASTGTKTLAP